MNREEISNKERYIDPVEFSQVEIKQSLDFIIKKIDENLPNFTDKFPRAASINLIYPAIDNTCWTASFWTGMLWLAYEYTGDNKYKDIAEKHILSFNNRLKDKDLTNTHDLGFLYTLSCVAGYKLTGSNFAKDTALKAADRLMDRYLTNAGIIQAWGDLNDKNQQGRMIIDCSMNLPLLYWASEITRDKKYLEAATSHIKQTAKYLVREDSSTFHTFYMDAKNGKPKYGKTAQGFSDDSCWSRGQAWGIYGFPLSYGYIHDTELLDITENLTNYFLNRLPSDEVCYWDLIFTKGDEERDSSAAAIATCGLLEYKNFVQDEDPKKVIYYNAALKIIKSLSENYTSITEPQSNGILLHGVYGKTFNDGIDECNIWGDYFYFEALMRLNTTWGKYW